VSSRTEGRRRRVALRFLVLVLLAAAAAGTLRVWPVRVPDPEPLRLVERRLVEATLAERVYELGLETDAGDTLIAYLRRPAAAPEGSGAYGAVVVAGRETGREAAAIIPPPIDGFVLAVEYPGEVPDALEVATLLRQLGTVRRTARRMPGLLRGAGHWLAGRVEVDPERTFLVGVSFGVPFAAAAARDPVFRGVALLYGGADLPLLFRTHLPVPTRAARWTAARALAFFFRDLEPGRHAGHIAPRPLLLINGLHDEYVPRASALRLRDAAREPVRQIWLDHGHLMPWHHDVMREMADSALVHFGLAN
jgi:fermentation-respiration switch protein FrsA (DUF1100 family)